MEEIQIFKNDAFGEVRVAEVDGKPYFCALDVTKVLGYSNGRDALAKHCKSRGVAKCDTPTQNQFGATVQTSMSYIDENNLYRLIMHSKQESAERFQDWVYDEVLPSIRKHGAYMSQEIIERTIADPDYLIQLATALKTERQKRAELEQKNQQQQAQLTEQAPKVLFADTVACSNTSILVGELAKLIANKGVKIGQNRLFEWMRQNGYICKKNGIRNYPTQRSIELGVLEVVERTVSKPDGSSLAIFTVKVTGKGQIYFTEKLQKLNK